jgi:nucleoside-triphosphatase THEP1
MESWVAEIRQRTATDWDSCIAIVGYTGVGKSTLAWRIGELLDAGFNDARMCLSQPEVEEALKTAQRGDVVVVDEGVEVVYSLDFGTRESKDFVRWLDVCRRRGVILLVLMARLRQMSGRVRDDRATYAFSVRARGRCIAYRRIGADPMGLDEEDPGGRWKKTCRVTFGKVEGPGWDAYMARKDARVMNYDPRKEREEKRARGRRTRRRDE